MADRKRKPSPIRLARSPPPKRPKQQPPKDNNNSNKIFIPGYLEDVITDQGQGLYEFKFPIASQNGLQRLAWGLDLRAQFVMVYLKFPDGKQSNFVQYCVHSSTDSEERQLRHRFHSSKRDNPISTPCSPRSTILTCVLTRELYGLTGLRQCRDLTVIYEKVWKIIKSDPTTHCLICGKNFRAESDVKIYTPTACAGLCMETLDKWPLRARLSHLLSDIKTLDFLLCSIYTAVDGQEESRDLYGTEDSLLVDCPLKLSQIQCTIDSLPKLTDMLSLNDILYARGDRGKLKHPRRKLLSWLSLRARGCLVSLKPESEYFIGGKSLDKCHQFMLLNSVLERQETFAKTLAQVETGSVAFHGCRATRTWNILTDALRDMYDKGYGVADHGIYFSDSPAYSLTYAAAPAELPFRAWKGSDFHGQSWAVLYGLQVADPVIKYVNRKGGPEAYTLHEGDVMIRYVLLIPVKNRGYRYSSSWGDKANLDTIINKDAMNKVFKVLDEGRLNPRQIGLEVDDSAWVNG